MKKGKTMTRKIVSSQIEFDATVADPQGVAVVQFVGDSVDLVVEKNFSFTLDYIGKSKLLIKPEAGRIDIQVEKAVKVVCDNPEASLRVYNVTDADIDRAESVAFHGVYTAACVVEAESISVSGSSVVSVTKAKTVSACDGSDIQINGPVGTVFTKDRVVVRAGEQARGVIRAKGSSRVTMGDGSDVTAYAYDASTVNAYSGRVLATDGSVVSVAGDVQVQATGCATVVLDNEEANVVTTGRAVLIPRLWDKRDLDKWVEFTGARVDGDDLVLYTWLDENPICPFYKAHKASIAEASAFLSASGRLFEVRVNKSDVTELWFDKLYATKFTPIREIDPADPFKENN